MEALTSRSRTELQHPQVHVRSFRVSALLIVPQAEQVLEDGSNRPIFRMFFPCHNDLYSSIDTNVPHETSATACARWWFLRIPITFKSSIAILSWFLMSSLEVLCKKSFRLFTTFSCAKASACLDRFPLYFEYLRERYFNFDCALRKYLSFSKTTPFDATKKVLIPKSTPTVVFSNTGAFPGASDLVSTNTEIKYLLVAVLFIVALLINPLISLSNEILIPSLNLGIEITLFLIFIICGIGNDPIFDFFLNLGKSLCALKNRLKAMSILIIDCCKDWLLTSFNHSKSVFNLGKLLIKSNPDKLTLVPAYVEVLVSKAQLYIKRQDPICFDIKVHWDSVGYILYLYALNIQQRYINLIQKENNVKDIFNNKFLTAK